MVTRSLDDRGATKKLATLLLAAVVFLTLLVVVIIVLGSAEQSIADIIGAATMHSP